jgi:hypothetical protein
MTRIFRLSVAMSAVLAAACSEAGPTAPAARPADSAVPAAHPGTTPVRSAGAALLAAGVRESGAVLTGGGMTYHGGPVILNPKVATIYWAASRIYNGGPTPGTAGAGSADGSLVGYFLNHLGGSPYWNILTTYYDGSGNHVNNSLAYTQFWANSTYNVPSGPTRVSDAQMLSMLQYAFNNGKLTYDAGTLYAIFTAGTVNLGGGFGTQYCAYHSDGFVTVGGVSKHVLYAAMPYAWAHSSACSAGYAPANGDAAADAEVNPLTAQIAKGVVNPYGTSWYDSSTGQDPIDRCAWTFTPTFTTANGGVANITLGTKSFLVQRLWVNVGAGYCALSY